MKLKVSSVLLLALFLVTVGCSSNPNQQEQSQQEQAMQKTMPESPTTYRVQGKIKGMPPNYKLLLSDISGEDILPLFEIVIDEQGNFEFSGDLNTPSPFMLTLLEKDENAFDPNDNLLIFMEATQMQVEGKAGEFAQATVTGSKMQAVFADYRQEIKDLGFDVAAKNQQAQQARRAGDMATFEEIEREYQAFYDKYVLVNKKLATQHPLTPVAAYVAYTEMLDTIYVAELQTIVSSGNTTPWVKYIQQYLDEIQSQADLQ
jgi:hypothetical protein